MGRYIEWEDVVGRYSQVAKLGGAESVGSHFIAYAESEVDSNLGAVYSVPFDTSSGAPSTVMDLAIDIAYVKAAVGRQKTVEKIAAMVEKKIKKIHDGKVIIVDSDGEEVTRVGGTVWSSNQDYTPIFGMGDTLDFVVDEDRIDDEEDARD